MRQPDSLLPAACQRVAEGPAGSRCASPEQPCWLAQKVVDLGPVRRRPQRHLCPRGYLVAVPSLASLHWQEFLRHCAETWCWLCGWSGAWAGDCELAAAAAVDGRLGPGALALVLDRYCRVWQENAVSACENSQHSGGRSAKQASDRIRERSAARLRCKTGRNGEGGTADAKHEDSDRAPAHKQEGSRQSTVRRFAAAASLRLCSQ